MDKEYTVAELISYGKKMRREYEQRLSSLEKTNENLARECDEHKRVISLQASAIKKLKSDCKSIKKNKGKPNRKPRAEFGSKDESIARLHRELSEQESLVTKLQKQLKSKDLTIKRMLEDINGDDEFERLLVEAKRELDPT